jgi:acyl-coenzyme A synthetase/AMP-(fatty) acid ligase
MQRYPLFGNFSLKQPLFYHGDEIITARDFLAEAINLAQALPEHRYVLNLCENRYHFILGFAAALIRNQTNILPPSRIDSVIKQVCSIYPDSYCLVDEHYHGVDLKRFHAARHKTEIADDVSIPVIPGEHDAVIIYTSGSTGEPAAHAKSWKSLVTGASILAKQFFSDVSEKIVIGTVPAQHMFGLETTVILPLQSGIAVHSGRPFFPDDLQMAMRENTNTKWLMTTPLHLRACVAEEVKLPGLEGVISATMPLPRDLAEAAEKLWNCPVYEIYGCTEAGMIASRRTVRGDIWQTCAGVNMTQCNGEVWAQGGHILNSILISDRVEIKNPNEFILQGRAENMIKIAGKRASLEHLNFELNQLPDIQEGVFFMPDGEERLVAFAVVAGVADNGKILADLRTKLDPVFLPRPLYRVESLPRNENGKITRHSLQQLLKELRGKN